MSDIKLSEADEALLPCPNCGAEAIRLTGDEAGKVSCGDRGRVCPLSELSVKPSVWQGIASRPSAPVAPASFEAACSGLQYSNPAACGEVAAIHFDGKRYAPAPQPEAGPSVVDVEADTGNAEADRIIGRLNSSDPDFDDCAEACVLIRKLVAEHKGPDGFATWKDAAIHERQWKAALARQLAAAQVPEGLTIDKAEAFVLLALSRRALKASPGYYFPMSDKIMGKLAGIAEQPNTAGHCSALPAQSQEQSAENARDRKLSRLGAYQVTHDTPVRAANRVFTMPMRSLITVRQEDHETRKVLIDFGGGSVDWFHESWLDKHATLEQRPASPAEEEA